MYVTFKEKGIDYAKQAVTEDEAGNHEEAMKMYMTSLEYFKTYLKYEKNVKAREAITGKFKEYLARAEYLKGLTGTESNGADAGAAAAQKVRKPGAGKEDDDKEKDKMKASLTGAILLEKPNVKWDDVAGLEGAKEALKEAVILPVKFPQFFTGQLPGCQHSLAVLGRGADAAMPGQPSCCCCNNAGVVWLRWTGAVTMPWQGC
ncbi:uncharacterized protein HaLaN_05164 [Haematococcus lacustris]|uniref:MIT domain-containing protein n=1 Tax=Haematococcus lacustris TaxID=44745 RepID=A0A699YIL4_HAELA|nr:uncharacterized protein HaLaN_05164 [Haematococcus lacustris]